MKHTHVAHLTQHPTEVLRDLIANPPSGSIPTQITPALAAEMLSYNTRNRPLTPSVVDRYAEQMADGKWGYTRVPVIFSDKGRLIDGQHRLSAIVQSGEVVFVDVAFGAPDETFDLIDVGKKRTAGDIFAINGVKDATHVAAATAWVFKYFRGSMHGGGLDLSIGDLYEFYLSHEGIIDSLSVGRKFGKSRLTTPSLMTAMHYLCARISRSQADAYFETLGDGFGATGKFDPALVVRNKLIEAATVNERLSTSVVAGLTATGWNQMRSKLSGRGLRYNATKPCPRLR